MHFNLKPLLHLALVHERSKFVHPLFLTRFWTRIWIWPIPLHRPTSQTHTATCGRSPATLLRARPTNATRRSRTRALLRLKLFRRRRTGALLRLQLFLTLPLLKLRRPRSSLLLLFLPPQHTRRLLHLQTSSCCIRVDVATIVQLHLNIVLLQLTRLQRPIDISTFHSSFFIKVVEFTRLHDRAWARSSSSPSARLCLNCYFPHPTSCLFP